LIEKEANQKEPILMEKEAKPQRTYIDREIGSDILKQKFRF
jgi:hypothetical protein